MWSVLQEGIDFRAADSADELTRLTWKGAEQRWPKCIPAEARTHIEDELKKFTLREGWAKDLLFAADRFATARQMGALVAPCRGRIAASFVAYCLGITEVDPLAFDLCAERCFGYGLVDYPQCHLRTTFSLETQTSFLPEIERWCHTYRHEFEDIERLLGIDDDGRKEAEPIRHALDRAEARLNALHAEGREVAWEELLFDSPAVFARFARGDTEGIYGFDTLERRQALRAMRPRNLEEILTLYVLTLPGPAQWFDTYLARRAGKEIPLYAHPLLVPILSATYGLFLWQEQGVRMLRDLTGYTPSKATYTIARLQRNTGMEAIVERDFIEGCLKNPSFVHALPEGEAHASAKAAWRTLITHKTTLYPKSYALSRTLLSLRLATLHLL